MAYTKVNVKTGDTILASDMNNISAEVERLGSVVNSKQDALVSGSNIKTINGQSIVGSGNITISSGGTSVEYDDTQIKQDIVSLQNNKADKSEIPDISGKQNIITDLSTIRAGASKGATALQPTDNITASALTDSVKESIAQDIYNILMDGEW